MTAIRREISRFQPAAASDLCNVGVHDVWAGVTDCRRSPSNGRLTRLAATADDATPVLPWQRGIANARGLNVAQERANCALAHRSQENVG